MVIPNEDHTKPSHALYLTEAASKNKKRRHNIARAREVCDQLEVERVRITRAEVARRCQSSGPAYSTICNTGSALGEYIGMRAVEQSLDGASTSSFTEVIDQISNPLLVAQIRDFANQAKWFRRENNALRGLLKGFRPGFDLDGALDEARKCGNMNLRLAPLSTGPDGEKLRPTLLKLLDHLVRDRRYELLRGRLAINQKIVLDGPELEMLRLAAGLDEETWANRYAGAR